MASFNKVILMGNLTRDPELKYLPGSNTPVVELGLAVNHRYKKQDGTPVEEVCFIDCSVFGRGAEVVNQYCRKGRPLMIEGRLRLDTWTDKEGQKRSKHRVFVENFTFVDSKGGGEGGGGGGAGGGNEGPEDSHQSPPPSRAPQRGPAPQRSAPPQAPQHDAGPPDMNNEDIPF
jgi:single-strand DNA-binding protein